MKTKTLLLVSLLLVLVMLVCSCGGITPDNPDDPNNPNGPASSGEWEQETDGCITYYRGYQHGWSTDENGQEIEIKIYDDYCNAAVSGTADSVTVPAEYKGVRVVDVSLEHGDNPTQIGTLTISEGIENVSLYLSSEDAFIGSVSIPASAMNFNIDCPYVGTITVAEGNPRYATYCGILYNKELTELLYVPYAISGDIVIPDTLVGYFDYNIDSKSVTSLDTGDGITNLPGGEYKANVETLIIGENVEIHEYGQQDFTPFASLVSITVSENHPDYYSENGIMYYKNRGENEVFFAPPMINPYVGQEGYYVTDDGMVYQQTFGWLDSVWYTVVGYYGQSEEITIRKEIDGISVLSINQMAFENKAKLKKVTIEAELAEIPHGTFSDCTALEEVILPDTVRKISDRAFSNCESLPCVDGVFYADDWAVGLQLTADENVSATLRDGTVGVAESLYKYTSGSYKFTSVPDSLLYVYDTKWFDTEIENGGIYIGNVLVGIEEGYSGNLTLRDGTVSVCVARLDNTRVGHVIVPGSVKYIDENFFYKNNGSNMWLEFNGTVEEWLALEYTTFNNQSLSVSFGGWWWNNGNPVIPEGVTEIKDNAFGNCGTLYSITISSGIERIGRGVAPSVVYYNGEIDEFLNIEWNTNTNFALYINGERLESFDIPDSMTDIGILRNVNGISFTVSDTHPTYFSSQGIIYTRDTFDIIYVPRVIEGELVIPEGVTGLGGKFGWISGVTSLVLPSTLVGFLPYHDFQNCCIESVSIAEDNPYLLYESGIIYDREYYSVLLVIYIDMLPDEVIIPEGVTNLPNVIENSNIKSIHLPSTLTYIAPGTLTSCSQLETVTVADGNEYLFTESNIIYEKENYSVIFCPKELPEEIVIPEGVTAIPYGIWNSYITSLHIPSTLTDISELHNFSDLQKLTVAEENEVLLVESGIVYVKENYNIIFVPADISGDIVIPEGVTSIGESFRGTAINSIHLPSTLSTFYYNSFTDCYDLARITVADGNAWWFAQDNVLYTSEYAVQYVPLGIKGEITVPDGITEIGDHFSGKAITSITLPASVYSLEDGAFANCTELVTISFGGSVKFNASSVFEGCDKLAYEEYGNVYYLGNIFIKPVSKDIVWARIKDGVTEIPAYAFDGCSKLGRVYVPSSVTDIGGYAFRDTNYSYFGCYFERSTSYIDFAAYANVANSDQTYKYQFSDMFDWVSINDDGIAYTYGNYPQFTGVNRSVMSVVAYFGDAEEVTVPATFDGYDVYMIAPNTFMDNNTTQKITIEGCDIVQGAAFWGCTELVEVSLPDNVQVGNVAFSGCSKLEKVTFGAGLLMIGMSAFDGCTSLKEVTCPDTLKAWTSDADLYRTFAANENLASYLLEGNKYHIIFNASIPDSQVIALINQIQIPAA